MHEAPDEGVLTLACCDLEIDAVDVQRIVHHILKAAVLYGDLPLTGDEVRGIGLGGEVASTTGAELDVEVLQRDVARVLGEDAHALGEVDVHILKADITALGDEDSGLGAVARAGGEDRPSGEVGVLPVGSIEKRLRVLARDTHSGSFAWSQLTDVLIREEHVGGAVEELARLRVEGKAMVGGRAPARAVGFQLPLVGDAPLDPRGGGEDDTARGVGVQDMQLRDLRIGEVDRKASELGALTAVEDDGEHAVFEEQFASLTLHDDVAPASEEKAYRAATRVVVIGDEVLALYGSLTGEVVAPRAKA